MSYEEFFSLLEGRRSIRSFDKKPLERVIIDKILAAAVQAPSIKNTQPWHFHVIEDAAMKKAMMECSCYGDFIEGAATFVVVTCNKAAKAASQSTIWNPREMEYSCVAAMTDMMLAAVTLGIGSCWVSLHHGPAHNLLKLPDHHVVIGGMMFGYAKQDARNDSADHERKPVSESVTYYA